MKDEQKYQVEVVKNIGCGLFVGALVPLLIGSFKVSLWSVLKLIYGMLVGIFFIGAGHDMIIRFKKKEDGNDRV